MIKGFSRLSKKEKIKLILDKYTYEFSNQVFSNLELKDKQIEALIESFSENTISTFPFPFSIAPNFLVDSKDYIVPFVTEESSVVAAASKSAKFWYDKGGFQTEIIGNTKNGQVHLKFQGDSNLLKRKFSPWKKELLAAVRHINEKMEARGGGIVSLELVDRTSQLSNYYQIDVGFNTCNAMGANFMNSCLEGIAHKFEELFQQDEHLNTSDLEVVMSILSNYSPKNAVKVWVECNVNDFEDEKLGMSAQEFAQKFVEAVKIAEVDVSRAVTHNKGVFNGVDSVALATGNDWRAIEANGHAYASSEGHYKSLSHASMVGDVFHFELTLPLQVGTIGGITAIHPLAKFSMQLLGNPSAEDLMKIMASAGLASNFAAVKSLVTTGIQKGHMKMHLSNILAGFNANDNEKMAVEAYFSDKTVSSSAVERFLIDLRK